jgi:hypothetical protein
VLAGSLTPSISFAALGALAFVKLPGPAAKTFRRFRILQGLKPTEKNADLSELKLRPPKKR